jgi:hypothetical protein
MINLIFKIIILMEIIIDNFILKLLINLGASNCG